MISTENRNVKHLLVQRIHEMCHRVLESGAEISILWIPSRLGIRDNEVADQAGKESAQRPPVYSDTIRDWISILREECIKLWKTSGVRR